VKEPDSPPELHERPRTTTDVTSATPALGPTVPARRSRRWVLELAVFLGFYLALSAFQERNLLAFRTRAPDFALESLDGGSVSLDSLAGKRVVLHFWATWCGVCRQELGMLNAIQKGLAKDEVLVTVVADSDDRERLRRFVAEEDIQYPVLLGNEELLRQFKIGSFPTNYYLDASGHITGHTVGMTTRLGVNARLWAARL
jgi:peroxiredoxin